MTQNHVIDREIPYLEFARPSIDDGEDAKRKPPPGRRPPQPANAALDLQNRLHERPRRRRKRPAALGDEAVIQREERQFDRQEAKLSGFDLGADLERESCRQRDPRQHNSFGRSKTLDQDPRTEPPRNRVERSAWLLDFRHAVAHRRSEARAGPRVAHQFAEGNALGARSGWLVAQKNVIRPARTASVTKFGSSRAARMSAKARSAEPSSTASWARVQSVSLRSSDSLG